MIRSSIFLNEKFSSTAEFQKLKARLVAGGHNMRNRSIFSENYTIASIAVYEGRSVVTADITGAYLNTDMKKSIYMRLEPKLNEPSYQEYTNTDGTLVVKLRKALYRCVESARLWCDNKIYLHSRLTLR